MIIKILTSAHIFSLPSCVSRRAATHNNTRKAMTKMPSVNKPQSSYISCTQPSSIFLCRRWKQNTYVGSMVYGFATQLMILRCFPTPNMNNERCYNVREVSNQTPTSHEGSLKYTAYAAVFDVKYQAAHRAVHSVKFRRHCVCIVYESFALQLIIYYELL